MAILFIITGRCRFLIPDFKAVCGAFPNVAILESVVLLGDITNICKTTRHVQKVNSARQLSRCSR